MRILYIISICLVSSLFFSCKDDDDKIDYAWKNANEEAFNALANNSDYQKAEIAQGPGYIYYKVLEPATVNDPDSIPKYTSVVRVLYKGRLIDNDGGGNGEVFDDSSYTPFIFKIDGSNFYLNGGAVQGTPVIAGWQIALQNMKEGEKWEVWIPWNLGYGAAKSGRIPGYSTLVFDIKLDKVLQLYPSSKEES